MKRRELLIGLSAMALGQPLRAGSFSLEDIGGGPTGLQTDVARQVAFAANTQWAIFQGFGSLAPDGRSPTGYSRGKKIDDPTVNQIIQSIAGPLFKTSSRQQLNWRIGLINDPAISGFTYGAGVVFLSSGLLQLCDREETLAGVIAHEIGHVDHGHLEQSRAAQAVLNHFSLNELLALPQQASGDLVNFLSDLTSISYRGYKRLQENEADAYIVRAFLDVGYDVQQADACSEMLMSLYGPQRPPPDQINCLYRTHPESLERLERVRAIQATYSNRLPPRTSGHFAQLKEQVGQYVTEKGHGRVPVTKADINKVYRLAQQQVLNTQGF